MSEMDLVRSDLRQHVEAVRAAAGRAMGGMLDMGRELLALKAACRHGEWSSAVAAAGVPERTAQRLMRAWREHQTQGTLDNPPSVTALLSSARQGKSDSVSGLGDLTVRDPALLLACFDTFEHVSQSIFEDEHASHDEKLTFACWQVKAGVNIQVSVYGAMQLWAGAYCSAYDKGKDCAADDCATVDVLYQAAIAGMQHYYREARASMGATSLPLAATGLVGEVT